ncbi:(+)-neomenthol dehydrogenase [Citrus sinensis]|nr:(+)-neomenthol dehydrogenase [Citrus sinensis]
MAETAKRYAVVTGANKGIGYEVVRQLALNGVITVLTARDEKGGLEAVEKLKHSGFDNVIFHQLDVADPAAIHSVADFIRSHFGKLDILVNNAGITGISSDADTLSGFIEEGVARGKMTQTYESAEKCLQTNYLGAKRMCEALIPLLQLSDSARIVNVSSSLGKLMYVTHEWAKGVFSDAENLTEERVDEVLSQYLNDYKEGSPETKGWPANAAAYILSKAAMNAYTRILAKKYPNFCINCVCPGYVKTEMTYNAGRLTVEEGAESPVWLALLHKGGPSVTVALTARDEKRGLAAVEKLKNSGCDNVIFHLLDVTDPASVDSLVHFVSSQFGKLDILVNNAGIGGFNMEGDNFVGIVEGGLPDNWYKMLTQTYELAEKCIQTNYYGNKRMCEALIPLLQLSDSPRIVNASSSMGKLKNITNEWAKGVLSDWMRCRRSI